MASGPAERGWSGLGEEAPSERVDVEQFPASPTAILGAACKASCSTLTATLDLQWRGRACLAVVVTVSEALASVCGRFQGILLLARPVPTWVTLSDPGEDRYEAPA